ncbi:PLP-dependent transferase [Calocera viscosa TUFC12733]|uniref:PLP-dependent transferase n=1 Tax=Calocera viscosa (strain TUFC12733) TaxID=1330018 RepID=A0A167R7M6_CALVF|nr:PLP-dependent transferase [Calocera viscosa TUFC12733]
MSLLFRHLRVHAVFGSNTDVGKTILTTALCRAGAEAGERVHYLKPVSTGSAEDADDLHVRRFKGPHREKIETKCLFQYDDPVSPHLAAARKPLVEPPTDAALLRSITNHLSSCARTPGWAWVETAGGVLSPSLSSTPQADTYRPLRLPVLLVGDSRLGGIGATLSAYESLTLRGYEVPLVLLFREEYYRNWEYLERWFEKNGKGTAVAAVPSVPERLDDNEEDRQALESYYSALSSSGEVQAVLSQLDTRHQQRIHELETLGERTMGKVWWPFTQHKNVRSVMGIDSAQGDFYSAYWPEAASGVLPAASKSEEPSLTKASDSILQPVFDGSASWWTQALGHSSHALTLAAAHAAGRYGHVIFPSSAHAPALELAERLLGPSGPGHGWAGRVFWSDDGSTAVEVALKMATRSVQLRQAALSGRKGEQSELGVLGLAGSYHGDTIGAMDASEPSVYSIAVPWYRGRGYWFTPPTVYVKGGHVCIDIPSFETVSPGRTYPFKSLGDIYNVPNRLSSDIANIYRQAIKRIILEELLTRGQRFGALLLEPLLMGAGGMLFVDPLFQRLLIDTVRDHGALLNTTSPADEEEGWKGLPVIFDEVFVGFDRLGVSPSEVLGVKPDIAAYAKILTGGLVPMSVTLASEAIFNKFLGDSTPEALLHGHSYTAHPIGCAVANRTMELIEEVKEGTEWKAAKERWADAKQGDVAWSLWDQASVFRISDMPAVDRAMAMGTVLAIDLRMQGQGYAAKGGSAFLDFMRKVWVSDVDLPFSGIHSRVLGKTLYFMCSLNTAGQTLRAIEKVLERTLAAWGDQKI